ncbi:hypothetical protein [Helicobacter sp.]|uniref:hypothetical protein n=1 Tax=Helicobacter sp. TaxID=218 RepID=UPI0025B909CB|nr:hypothetical protein [Helicobacter sp.]
MYKISMIISIYAILCVGCSDFYRKDFIHIPSAHNTEQETQKEQEIQATRKGQILENNHTRVVMIVRYMNEISKNFVKDEKGEVFLVELYARNEQIPLELLSFNLSSTYKSLEAEKISKQNKQDLGEFAPDIAYNNIYKVVFGSMGFRGRDNLKLTARIEGIGEMNFDFSYAKRKSNLTQ